MSSKRTDNPDGLLVLLYCSVKLCAFERLLHREQTRFIGYRALQ